MTFVMILTPVAFSNVQGYLVFEKDASFDNNLADTADSTNQAKGGAISNTAQGTILFKGKLYMNNNNAQVRLAYLRVALVL